MNMLSKRSLFRALPQRVLGQMRGPAPRLGPLAHFALIDSWYPTLALGQRPLVCATNRNIASSLLLFQSLNKLLYPNAEEFPYGQISMERVSFLNML